MDGRRLWRCCFCFCESNHAIYDVPGLMTDQRELSLLFRFVWRGHVGREADSSRSRMNCDVGRERNRNAARSRRKRVASAKGYALT